jgi:membrane protein implicated in regulation of membrane protease activity
MLGVFEMVAIIVVAVLLANLIKEWLRTKQTPEVDLSPVEDRIDKLESLEERIRVLEAIVTDKGYDLKKEIDDL